MEDLSRLVSASLAHNGVKTDLNCQRLEWSRWFRCESSFSVLLAPSKPGIFALGEEMIPEGGERKRMLALFEIAETGDLGISLGRLFLPGGPLREKLESGNCFARYTVIEDPVERASAYSALRRWMDQSAEAISPGGVDVSVRDEPSVSLVRGKLEQDRKMQRPAPLPLGF